MAAEQLSQTFNTRAPISMPYAFVQGSPILHPHQSINQVEFLHQSLNFNHNLIQSRLDNIQQHLAFLATEIARHFGFQTEQTTQLKEQLDAQKTALDTISNQATLTVQAPQICEISHKISNQEVPKTLEIPTQQGKLKRLWIGGFRTRQRSEKDLLAFLEISLKVRLINAKRLSKGSFSFYTESSEVSRLLSLTLGNSDDFPSGLKIERYSIRHRLSNFPEQPSRLEFKTTASSAISQQTAQSGKPVQYKAESSTSNLTIRTMTNHVEDDQSRCKEVNHERHKPEFTLETHNSFEVLARETTPDGSKRRGRSQRDSFESTQVKESTTPQTETGDSSAPSRKITAAESKATPEIGSKTAGGENAEAKTRELPTRASSPVAAKPSDGEHLDSTKGRNGKPSRQATRGKRHEDSSKKLSAEASVNFEDSSSRGSKSTADSNGSSKQKIDAGALSSTPVISSPSTPQLSKEEIERDFDLKDGHRTLGTKRWLASEQSHGKVVIDLPGIGNCFYEALVSARIPLPRGTSVAAATRSGQHRSTTNFRTYKAAILDFLDSDFFQEKLDDQDFLSKFPSLLQIDRDEIRKCLQTDGKWADETLVQLTAIALDVEIKIEDLSRPGEILVTFESLGGHNKASQMLHLLFRVDKKHPVYTENFQLMQEGGKLITSDGHFWLVQNSPTSSKAAKRGNMQGSVLARPE